MIIKLNTALSRLEDSIPAEETDAVEQLPRVETNAPVPSLGLRPARRMADRVRTLEAENQELQNRVDQLSELAYTDALTGLANRRYFTQQTKAEIDRAFRGTSPLALALCDVDALKTCNDSFGHQCGDNVLRRIGATLRQIGRRSGDFAARYGGDEFALLLPDTGSYDALVIADRLRRTIADSPLVFGSNSPEVRVTVSVGLTIFTGKSRAEAGDLVLAADRALYQAKNAGGNHLRFMELEALEG